MKMGSGTGRGAGFCNDFVAPGCANPTRFTGDCGYGFGHGRGFCSILYTNEMPGRAHNENFADTETNPAAFDKRVLLKGRAELLENQLQQGKKRFSILGGGNE